MYVNVVQPKYNCLLHAEHISYLKSIDISTNYELLLNKNYFVHKYDIHHIGIIVGCTYVCTTIDLFKNHKVVC